MTVRTSLEALMRAFGVASAEPDLDGMPLRWNGAPSLDYALIVREPDLPGPHLIRARWGFIPSWMRDPKGGRRPINAKSETVATNGLFRAAFRSGRALMPVDSFFEWKAIAGEKAKQPFAIAMADGGPFTLAAIWSAWNDPKVGRIRTFAVLTCEANAMMREIHERMPVIVAPEDRERWLTSETPPEDLLRPFPSDLMTMWPVSRDLNRPANDTPDLVTPIEP